MVELRLARCLLRDWRFADDISLSRHADDIRIWRNVRDRFPHPYTVEHAREWIGSSSAADPTTDLAITVDGEAVGGIGLVLGEDISRVSAEVGYWLGAEHWGKGIATEAVRAFSAWAFAVRCPAAVRGRAGVEPGVDARAGEGRLHARGACPSGGHQGRPRDGRLRVLVGTRRLTVQDVDRARRVTPAPGARNCAHYALGAVTAGRTE